MSKQLCKQILNGYYVQCHLPRRDYVYMNYYTYKIMSFLLCFADLAGRVAVEQKPLLIVSRLSWRILTKASRLV